MWTCIKQMLLAKHALLLPQPGTSAFLRSARPLASLSFKTVKTNANELTLADVGLWHTISKDEYDKIYPGTFIDDITRGKMEAICDYSFMVRRPYLEIVNCMKNLIADLPVNRYLLYGKLGTGKTTTVLHLMHYAYKEKYIVCHFHNLRYWNRWFVDRELVPSMWRPGRIDMPVPASQWLKNFLHINKELLAEFSIKTTKQYNWTNRETTPAGSPLANLIEFGINRVKFASDCVGAVLRELKIAANSKQAKVFVSVDHVNSLYDAETTIKKDDLLWAKPRFVQPRREIRFQEPEFARACDLTLNHAVEKLIRNDWANGVVVLVVDNSEPDYRRGYDKRDMIEAKPIPSHLPYSLLGQVAFDNLNPFIPLKTELLNDIELVNMFDYFLERRWVILPEGMNLREAKEELKYLTGRSPKMMDSFCAAL